MPELTLTEAATEIGKSKSTLLRAIHSGKLSANRNEHGDFEVDPAELHRVYPKRTTATDMSSGTEQQPTDQMAPTLLEMVQEKDDQIAELRSDLEETEQRLNEHREAAKALMSPDDFEARLKAEVDRAEQAHQVQLNQQKETHATMLARQQKEQAKAVAEQRQQSEKWKAALGERQREIEAARREAETLKQQATEDIARIERRAAGERAVREALENRGIIARLLNRKPVVEG